MATYTTIEFNGDLLDAIDYEEFGRDLHHIIANPSWINQMSFVDLRSCMKIVKVSTNSAADEAGLPSLDETKSRSERRKQRRSDRDKGVTPMFKTFCGMLDQLPTLEDIAEQRRSDRDRYCAEENAEQRILAEQQAGRHTDGELRSEAGQAMRLLRLLERYLRANAAHAIGEDAPATARDDINKLMAVKEAINYLSDAFPED